MNETTPAKKPFKPYLELFCENYALLILTCSDVGTLESEIKPFRELLDKTVKYTGLTEREIFMIAKCRHYVLFTKAESYVDSLVRFVREFGYGV